MIIFNSRITLHKDFKLISCSGTLHFKLITKFATNFSYQVLQAQNKKKTTYTKTSLSSFLYLGPIFKKSDTQSFL